MSNFRHNLLYFCLACGDNYDWFTQSVSITHWVLFYALTRVTPLFVIYSEVVECEANGQTQPELDISTVFNIPGFV